MSSNYTGSDLVVDALESYGVTHVFGNPGTTEVPLLNALGDSELQYVLGLHEDIAVGMAAGYASTRRYHAHKGDAFPLGVVNLHVAPGLAHGLGNLQNAHQSGVPLLVTAGEHGTSHRHEEPILSGDLVKMAEEYTKWSAVVEDVSALPTMLRRAIRTALTPPTAPVFLGFPIDVMMAETDERPERLGGIPAAGRGDRQQIEAAVRELENATDPVLVLGDQVARTGPRGIEAATTLAAETGMPVYSEMATGEINYPPGDDQWVSFIAPDPDMARVALDSDALVFVGCSTNVPYIPYDEAFVPDDATTIHIGDEAWELGKNEPADIAIVGDPGSVMSEIAGLVDVSEAERERRYGRIPERREEMEPFHPTADVDAPSISKPALAETLATVAPDALVVNESNTSKYPLLTRWPLDPEQFIANKNGGLGYALPAAVGAGIAVSQSGEKRSVIGFIGDGSFLYYPQTMYTAARYGVDVTVVVPNNRNYRILKDGMLEIFGGTDDDYDYVGMDIDPEFDIAENTHSQGVVADSVRDIELLESTLREAVTTDKPALVDVRVED
ncbi:thiamine pyrophosphate-binding protein [Halopenitus persicus]|uniref:Benzoylformate decarboxylase n=1 Tax=Halopenitus persicus TaxID=1048396 RepID=A0A1H3E6G8_9EURY|nr:thiamine pyrophosphate-binding protein [Halopenitus persicus]SDX74281.1 benzoylformate decarboxylase [Halopenitus persicus]